MFSKVFSFTLLATFLFTQGALAIDCGPGVHTTRCAVSPAKLAAAPCTPAASTQSPPFCVTTEAGQLSSAGVEELNQSIGSPMPVCGRRHLVSAVFLLDSGSE
ncbi:hypothetical protein FB45DRAFT_870377 [Roridomyces roridus]|uniref:Secreted protein n=1 Tax=Roridomyces roridus TaxID=1738132 RepID=A0AAD7FJ86_9AGAR|nr:hypothetical protein FB45DRAFT_870377 [Roridomyces roridus]